MSGTKAGALKAAQTLKAKYGNDVYSKMGQKGGKACVPKGFAANIKLAKLAGARGGSRSRRGCGKLNKKS